MKLKPLACKGFGILTAATVASLALGAAPASASITELGAECPISGYEGSDPRCENSHIWVGTTDSTPVWLTVNGTVLGGSPFPVTLYAAGGGYGAGVYLDCAEITLHVTAMQKSADGTITSQKSIDYTPAYPRVGSTAQSILAGSASGSASPTCHVV
ncbi:hypothetical protein [Nocardia sp. NPDC004711]